MTAPDPYVKFILCDFLVAVRNKLMRALIVILLFVGMAMILHSIYKEKLERAEKNVRVEYRFLPRTLYEEQMSEDNRPTTKLKGVF
jgi:hypothetical protein